MEPEERGIVPPAPLPTRNGWAPDGAQTIVIIGLIRMRQRMPQVGPDGPVIRSIFTTMIAGQQLYDRHLGSTKLGLSQGAYGHML